MSIPLMVWELKRGDRFKVEGSDIVWEFRSMDGAYCYSTDNHGNVLNWSGPVEKLIEPASEMDDDSQRMVAIGQNGNNGEHYE